MILPGPLDRSLKAVPDGDSSWPGVGRFPALSAYLIIELQD